MHTVIFDTNLLLDFFVFSDPRTVPLWEAAKNGTICVVTSEPCLFELRDVLTRSQFNLSSSEVEDAVQSFCKVAKIKEVTHAASAKCKDPDDQKFLDLLEESAPAILVTKDKLVLRCRRLVLKLGCDILEPLKAANLFFSKDF